MSIAVVDQLASTTPRLRRRLVTGMGIVLLACPIVVVAAVLGHRTIWNLSASVPRGLYLVVPRVAYQRGSLVSFRPFPRAVVTIYARHYLPFGAGLIKQLVGLPGDRVCIGDDGFYVNDVRFGDVARFDSRGRPLAAYPFCGAVPPGQAFVATKARLSYDSRYFGPVPISSLTAVVPLWTY